MPTPKRLNYQQFLLASLEGKNIPEMISYLRELEYAFIDKGADPREQRLVVNKPVSAYFEVSRMETLKEAQERETQESLAEFRRKYPFSIP